VTSDIRKELISYYKKTAEINGINFKINKLKEELTEKEQLENKEIKNMLSRKNKLIRMLKDLNTLLLNLSTNENDFLRDYYLRGKGTCGKVVADKYRYSYAHTHRKARMLVKRLNELYQEFYT